MRFTAMMIVAWFGFLASETGVAYGLTFCPLSCTSYYAKQWTYVDLRAMIAIDPSTYSSGYGGGSTLLV